MLKETKTEKTIVFLVTFLSFVAFQLGGGPPGLPMASPMLNVGYCILFVRFLGRVYIYKLVRHNLHVKFVLCMSAVKNYAMAVSKS